MLAQNKDNNSPKYSYRFYLEIKNQDGYTLYGNGNIYKTSGEMESWDYEETTLISTKIEV